MYFFIFYFFLFIFFYLFLFLFYQKLNIKLFFNWQLILSITFVIVSILLYNLYIITSYNFFSDNFFLFNIKYSFYNVIFLDFYFPFVYIFLIVTFATLIYLMSYNLNELYLFLLFIFIIYLAGLGLFLTNSYIYFFIFYELLLLPSFLILYNYAKTRKCVEAAFLMFFWTQFGALFLIFNFSYLFILTNSTLFKTLNIYTFSNFQLFIIILFFLIGFGVKFPIWPFYDWLPKAHVEASTNFSIFLSGVLVKFAFFGFFKCLLYLYTFFNLTIFYVFLFIGIIDSSLKLYYQLDLKKLIAYATVLEMHWLTLALLNGQSVFWIVVFIMLISHAFISSNFFLIIDSVTRRYKTRLILEINGLNILMPKLYFSLLVLLIIFLGFPGSFLFISEFLFFSFFTDLNFFLTFLLLLILYFFAASCFFKNWFFLLFGYSYWFTEKQLLVDIDSREFFLFSFFSIFIFILGFTNSFFF